MIVLGTRPEYFNAVWVKNEWSRYLALIKSGAKKALIPAYKGMDPYALPDEFSHLQALDMAKLGFSQDLLHGLRKIAPPRSAGGTDEEETAAGVDALLRRISLFLEDRDFESAGAYCERVLDLEPENAEAYVCKLLVERRLTSEAELPDCDTPLPESGSYQKAMRRRRLTTGPRSWKSKRRAKSRSGTRLSSSPPSRDTMTRPSAHATAQRAPSPSGWRSSIAMQPSFSSATRTRTPLLHPSPFWPSPI